MMEPMAAIGRHCCKDIFARWDCPQTRFSELEFGSKTKEDAMTTNYKINLSALSRRDVGLGVLGFRAAAFLMPRSGLRPRIFPKAVF